MPSPIRITAREGESQRLVATTIKIGDNTSPFSAGNGERSNNRSSPKWSQHQKNDFPVRRSAFIPDKDDKKEFISKDESEHLRNSILHVNRPRISRPSFDRSPPKNSPPSMMSGSARSNSSSGCSSNPQSSGPSSPVSSKCSSEGSSNGAESSPKCAGNAILIGNRTSPNHMISPSLVQKAISGNKASTSAQNANKYSPSSSSASVPLLKRKEFPSYQRRWVPISSQKNLPPFDCQSHQPSRNSNLGLNQVDPTEEVEELSRAARKQLVILEELELEDRERKTRISSNSNLNDKSAPFTGTDEVGSGGTATNTRLSSNPSTSSTSSPRPLTHYPQNSIDGSPSVLMPRKEWTAKSGQKSGRGRHAQQQMARDTREQQKAMPTTTMTLEWISAIGEQDAAGNVHENIKRNGPLPPKHKAQQHTTRSMDNKNVGNGISSAGNCGGPQLECKACGRMITDVILQAVGASFHPACFRCSKCGKCLDGIPFAVDPNGAASVICMDDYERHFVPHCHSCKKPISAVNEFGQVVRVIIKDREYHIQCYCCEGCGMQLSNEEQSRCYPLADHLLCRRCHTLWKRVGAMDTEAIISDL